MRGSQGRGRRRGPPEQSGWEEGRGREVEENDRVGADEVIRAWMTRSGDARSHVCWGEGSAVCRPIRGPVLSLDVESGLSLDTCVTKCGCQTREGRIRREAPDPPLSPRGPSTHRTVSRVCSRALKALRGLPSTFLPGLTGPFAPPNSPPHFHPRAFAQAAPSAWGTCPSHVPVSRLPARPRVETAGPSQGPLPQEALLI